jgi:hypothetical protein
MVPAGGIEPPSQIENTELIDFTKRYKRSKRQKRRIRLRGGYARAHDRAE